ncbi:MAG: AAA family ATPase [Acidimicrobiia bacterium]|nr:AAA family ATPase [Acidimicrobiia bacterium]
MIYRFDRTELDTGTCELRHDGGVVHVEPQVLAVLEHLIAHRNRVVSKMELLDEVWGDRFVSESALTSRIKSARRACGDSGRQQRVIRTVHGRGYRFVADVTEAGEAAPALGPTAAPTPAVRPSATLIGRSVELDRLEAALDAARSGRRQGVFLTGEAGAGKSALLAELLERVDSGGEAGGWMVLRGQCLQSRGGAEPYFSLLDALARHGRVEGPRVVEVLEQVAPSWLAQIPSLVDPDLAARLEPRVLGATPLRMLREGADTFETLAASCPVLLALEDLHWADDCTLDVVELLVQRTGPAPLVIVGTARREPDRIRGLIAAMTSSGRATELRLGPLPAGAVAALVDDWFAGAAVPAELHDVVARRSDGIPLFAQEMLGTWVRDGAVTVDGGVVAVTVPLDALEATVPESVRELIERELVRLEPDEAEVLESAAVAGDELDGAAVAAGLGRPLAEVEDALATLSRRQHLLDALGGVEWPDGTVSTRFRFRHELHRQVVYERIPAAHRARLHRAVGEAIERGYRGRPGEVLVELAHHFVEGGDLARSVEYLRRAGEQATARSAHRHAAGFLGDALARVERLPEGEERDRAELRVRLSLGPTLVATGGWFGAQVLENYERALELCGARGPCHDADLARYGLATVTELRGEYERTEALLLPVLDAPPEELVLEARELMACSTFHQGRFERSLENAFALLDRWGADDHSALMARLAEHPAASCNSWASLASWYLGRSDESLHLAERAVELGEQNLYALSTARVQRAFLHQFRAEPEACGRWAELAGALAEEQGFPMRNAQALILRGWVDAASGRAGGVEGIAEGLALFRSFGARLTEPYFLGLQADALLAAGEPVEAMARLDEALTGMRETTRSFFYEPELHRLRARAVTASGGPGAPESARELLDLALETAERSSSPPLALRAATDRLRLERDHGEPGPWRPIVAGHLARFDGQADASRRRRLKKS